jgi:hypothetical protein
MFGTVLTGEKPSARRKTCPSVILSTIKLTRNDLRSNPGLGSDRPVTNDLNIKTQFNLTYTYRSVNTPSLDYKSNKLM